MARALPARKKRALSIARPADREFAVALAAFYNADFDGCRSLLDVAQDAADSSDLANRELLAARLARISGDAVTWKSAAERAAAAAKSEGQRYTALALIGLADRDLGRTKEADRTLAKVAAAVDADDAGGIPYPGYLCAVDAWLTRDYARAERLAKKNLRLHPNDSDSIGLLGWIDIKRERFKSAGTWFSRALARGREAESFELRSRARLIHAIALVASDLADPALGRKALREYNAMTWPATLGVERFNTLSCLRLSSLVSGDVASAWFFAREAAIIAPTDAYRALGETNAAVGTALLGDRVTAELQMRRAWETIRKIRWSEADDEQRVALTHFACEGARTMPNEARQALMLYISLRGKRNPANSLTEDRRVTAYEALAAGRVSEAIGEKSEAAAHYRKSLEIWRDLGFVVRAAIVATDLRRLTRDAELTEVVDELRDVAPGAWLLGNPKGVGPIVDTLPPAQRRVLAGILRGDDAKTIARDLGRSRFTIDNHTRKIFKALGVHLRAEVRRLCRRDGITPESLSLPGAAPR